MKRTFLVLSLVVLGAVVFGSYGEAQMQHERHHQETMEKAESEEVVCPVTNRVMKRAEAPASYTLHFASEAAKEAFLTNPAKFFTATCPVMGGEANKLTAPYSNYDGVAYHFCCAGCKQKFEKEPKKYIGKMPEQSGEQSKADAKAEGAFCNVGKGGCSMACLEKGQSGHSCAMSQKSDVPTSSAMMAEDGATTDPVCGMTISSKDGVHTAFQGKEYHFCSAQCKEKFEEKPEAYIKK